MDENKVKEVIKLLRILSLGLIGTVVFLLLVAVIMLSISGKPLAGTDTELERTMLIVLFIIAAGGILYGNYAFRKKIPQVRGKDLVTVLETYRGIMILRLALVESAAFFGVITYLLLGSMTGLVISVLLLFYMMLLHPTDQRLKKETGIDLKNPGG